MEHMVASHLVVLVVLGYLVRILFPKENIMGINPVF